MINFIQIPLQKEILIVKPCSIIRIETESSFSNKKNQPVKNGDGNFTRIFLKGGKIHLICKQIGEWEKELISKPSFFRSHQSHLVNLTHLLKIETYDSYILVLDSGKEEADRIPVARSKIRYLKRLLR